MSQRAAVLVVSCGALLSGCGTESRSENQEIISNLLEAGFPADDILVVHEAVYVGRDAHVRLEASREMLQPGAGSAEQYRTNNLVATALVRKICVTPTTTFNLYPNLSLGLDMALENYNALGLCFSMARGPATGCDANIIAQTTSGIGYSSGYPSGGMPYETIDIGIGLQSSSVDMAEHVITHALGHTIGLRHSDYYDRSISCGSGGSEGSAGVGAIHIPGTPASATVGGSLMNSCSRPNESGEFTGSDIAALMALYGHGC